MSQRSAYSECTVTGPLMAAIMGTSISSMFSRIVADVTERVNQRLVHIAVEHKRAASSMQSYLEDAVFPLHPHVLIFFAIAFERMSFHRCLRSVSSALFIAESTSSRVRYHCVCADHTAPGHRLGSAWVTIDAREFER